MIPPEPESPHTDCHFHMGQWIHFLESQLQRNLQPDDYIFPAIASTGRLKFGEAISRSAFENLMEEVVQGSGVLKNREHGRFTTHCFRRGGAQYRFMWAPRKWSLKAVKWWGGWSSSEHVSASFQHENEVLEN